MPNRTELFHFKGSIDQLPALIQLFYGFAIANGLADGVKSVIEKGASFRFIFLVLALFLALADWISYFIHIAPFRYKGVIRFLMDLMCPVFVYCLLISPGIASSGDYIIYISYVLCAYFLWAIIYAILLRRDVIDVEKNLFRIIMSCVILSAAAVIFGYYDHNSTESRFIIELLISVGVVLWTGYNIRLLHLAIRERSSSD
jgi:hypothetical protein